MELFFEDIIQSEDQEIINQIDDLMVKISKDPLRNNPQAIFAFISKHIFLAKYSFYIKRDPRVALEILNDAKDRIKTFKLDNLDISVKERIKQSEFNKYVQQALSLADKQM